MRSHGTGRSSAGAKLQQVGDLGLSARARGIASAPNRSTEAMFGHEKDSARRTDMA
eukprot:CAMPEP_0206017436 /NCGR_PEP_ID=MMETSP1464-20131121/25026_1 /ASSEMBLY_ACC=CAM_ASM_001124 /TAXON_ID=119497 /ORGANISM="Exanthemachrysis gayraliae, Strain RCC1523" /LENGTH=55 /DNA_ID=CAMNT_0053391283 /DNA_START=592 /DNA_END=756 /DNA_ORIENTATION=-